MATTTSCDVQNGLSIVHSSSLPHTCASQSNIDTALSILFVTLGGFALLMVVIGGIRYVTAGGNPDSVAKARSMIIYSLIGLVIAAMAAAIVNVVLGWLQ